jgi:hypothetical protein
MRLTRMGMGASLAAIALASTAALYHDLLIGVGLLFVLAMLASEAAWVAVVGRRAGARISLTRITDGEKQEAKEDAAQRSEPGRRDARRRGPTGKAILYPGDERVERLRLVKKVGGKLEFESRVPFMTISPRMIEGVAGGGEEEGDPATIIEFRFKTRYAGEYSSGEVGVLLTGPIGLFCGSRSIRVAQKYVVHPRLLSVTATTFSLLLGRAQRLGEASIEAPGPGSEFYEMRAHQPGDDYRRVNWKATARQSKLLVNESMREAGSPYLIVLDARARGFYETDRLASTFLSIANNLAAAGLSFGVLIHDGSRVTARSLEDDDPRGSLGVALRAVVSIAKLESDPEFMELVPVRAPPDVWRGEDDLCEKEEKKGRGIDPLDAVSPLGQLQVLRGLQSKSVLGDAEPWSSISRYIHDRAARNIVYVSGLHGAIEPLLDIAWQARYFRGSDLSVANPCNPWALAETKEEAAKLFSKYQAVGRALEATGIRYYCGEPIQLASRCLSG